MSSLTKMLAILDLFTEEKTKWHMDAIVEEMDFSVPTAYRYIKTLIEAGLLAKVNSSEYIIGPKIIKLDRQIRISDPYIVEGKSIMRSLQELTGCQVLLSNIFDSEVINIYSVNPPNWNERVTYARGIPHPLFKGSTSKVIFAYLPRAKLIKLYNDNLSNIALTNMGKSWQDFLLVMSAIKKQGYSISHGELDSNLTGIAAPIFSENVIKGSLTLIVPTQRLEVYNLDRLITYVTEAASQISSITNEL